jgi:hypothetical protein
MAFRDLRVSASPRALALQALVSMPRSKGMVIGFWIVTALFCLQRHH